MTENEKLKNKIITDLYLTGKVAGQYMTKFPKGNQNPLKHYIKMKLEAYYKIYNEQDYYIDEVYSTLFLELSKIGADKFVEQFANNTQKLTATACRIILLKGFYKMVKQMKTGTDAEGNPIFQQVIYHKHSRMTDLLFASSLNHQDENVISPIEVEKSEDSLTTNEAIFIVEDDKDHFHDQYNISVEEILSQLTPDEIEIFYLLASGKKGRQQQQQKIKDLKEKISLIKRKIDKKMNEQDLYNVLQPLEHLFEGYKDKSLSAISADDIQRMQTAHQAFQQVYPGVLPRIFTSSCSACTINVLEQFIMTFERLNLTYHVEPVPEVIEPVKAKKKK